MREPSFVLALRLMGKGPREILKAMIVLLALGPMVVGGTAAAAFFVLPLPAVIPDPIPGAEAQTSFVYASDGSLLARFHAEHDREIIPVSDVPDHFIASIIAAEDSRFFKHSGLDLKAIGRALWADVTSGEIQQGGSTITQQYVKNAYIERPKRNIFRKVREALLASQVERRFGKTKILENYLNTVYLGHGAYGVQAAAKTYFGKEAKDLTISESALLVGLIRSPSRTSPYESPEVAESRRQLVLDRLAKVCSVESGAQTCGALVDLADVEAARSKPPKVVPIKQEIFKFPWFVDAVRSDLTQRYASGDQLVFSGGLRIETTVDPRLQEAAERIVKTHLSNPPKDPIISLVAIDPQTGYIKALATNDPYTPAGYNIPTDGLTRPGSSFKTIGLVAALEEGISPRKTYRAPARLPVKGWGNKCQCVTNFGDRGWGTLTLETATVQSVNTVFAQVATSVGAEKMVDVATRMGVKKSTLEQDHQNPAIVIGALTTGVSPLELASMYATLGGDGIYRKPSFVSRVSSSSGTVLERGGNPGKRAIAPDIAATVNQILEKVLTVGTGRSARIDRPAAAKSGTDQDFQYATFVGYTPDLSVVVTMGYRDSLKPLFNINGVRRVTGGSIPAKIWKEFMEIALDEIPPSEFGEASPTSSRRDDGRLRLPYRPQSPKPSPSPSPSPSPKPSPSPSPSPSPGVLPSPPDPDPSPSLLP